MKEPRKEKPIIGWREWLALPGLGVARIKAKIDTGARSSSLHVTDLQVITSEGKEVARFEVHPDQRDGRQTVRASAEVLEFRRIRSSSGHIAERPIIVTEALLLGVQWSIEVSLTRRDEMGFRMLLGREALRGQFIVDPGRSYYSGRPPRSRRRQTKTDR